MTDSTTALITRARRHLDQHDLRILRPLAHELLAELEALAAGLIEARTDPVTRLPTRAAWTAAAEQLAAAVPTVLVFADLDGFKQVNDTFGHEAGDTVLAATARRLADWAGPAAALARLGGDEFVALVADTTDSDDRARELARRLADPVAWRGRLLHVGASIGTARLADAPAGSLSAALHAADQAMYAAKGRGRRGRRRPSPAWLPRRRTS